MESRIKPLPLDLTTATTNEPFQPQQQHHVPPTPPSPTFSTTSLISSMSWIADKAPQELIPMIKNAYSSLKEKEKGKQIDRKRNGRVVESCQKKCRCVNVVVCM